jgi:hypothetical protein
MAITLMIPILLFLISTATTQPSPTISTGGLVGAFLAFLAVIGIAVIYRNRKAIKRTRQIYVEHISKRVGHVLPGFNSDHGFQYPVELATDLSEHWTRDRLDGGRLVHKIESKNIESAI